MESIGIKFPFKETEGGGLFEVTITEEEKIQSNLIAFLTLQKGQRVMHNDLYSPLYDSIMESWDEITESELRDGITKSINKFFTDITLTQITFSFDEDTHLLSIVIYFNINDLKMDSSVEIALPLE